MCVGWIVVRLRAWPSQQQPRHVSMCCTCMGGQMCALSLIGQSWPICSTRNFPIALDVGWLSFLVLFLGFLPMVMEVVNRFDSFVVHQNLREIEILFKPIECSIWSSVKHARFKFILMKLWIAINRGPFAALRIRLNFKQLLSLYT